MLRVNELGRLSRQVSMANRRNATRRNGSRRRRRNDTRKNVARRIMADEEVQCDVEKHKCLACVPGDDGVKRCKCSYSLDYLEPGQICDASSTHPPNVSVRIPLHRIPMPQSNEAYDSSSNLNETTVMNPYVNSTQPNSINTTSVTTTPAPIFTVVIAISLSCATFFFLLLTLVCWLRRKHLTGQDVNSVDVFCLWRRPKLSPGLQALGKTSVLDNQHFTANPNYYTSPPEIALLKSLLHLEISGEKLVFLHVIGEGCFGKVFKGVFQKNETEVCEVAIKILKDNSSNETQVDFLREVEVMSSFDHQNILALLGVAVIESGATPWMVFEYMEYGDLAEVLRENSPYFWNSSNITCKIGKADLSYLAIQIASGMIYLSSQHFVHRDLATRNCLLGKNLVVKISDFGMTRDIYTCDYYKIGGSRMLPVRWMSPESVMYGKFTLESDIWSFGVVLWEIFAYGKQPYYGHSNEEVVKLIRQGILLTPPEDCPHYVCQLMEMCWRTNPYDRMKFPQIHDLLVHKGVWEDSAAQRPQSTPTVHNSPSATTNDISLLHSSRSVGVSANDSVDDHNYLVPRSAYNE